LIGFPPASYHNPN